MFALEVINAMNKQADKDAKAKRIALIKSELAKLDNVVVKELIVSLKDKE